ncbi:MAG: hypothetical protein ACE5KM_04675 [Planctomycetaceae bacterium]
MQRLRDDTRRSATNPPRKQRPKSLRKPANPFDLIASGTKNGTSNTGDPIGRNGAAVAPAHSVSKPTGDAAAPFPAVQTVSRAANAEAASTRKQTSSVSGQDMAIGGPPAARLKPERVADVPKASRNPFAGRPPAHRRGVHAPPWESPSGTSAEVVSEADESMIVGPSAASSRVPASPATVLQRTVESAPPSEGSQTDQHATPEIRIIPRRTTYRLQPTQPRAGGDDHSARNAILREIIQVAGEDRTAGPKSPLPKAGRMEWKPVSRRRESPAKPEGASRQPPSGSDAPVELPAPIPESNARSMIDAANAGGTRPPAIQVKDLDFGREPAEGESRSRIPLLLVLSLVAVLAIVAVRRRRKRFSRT